MRRRRPLGVRGAAEDEAKDLDGGDGSLSRRVVCGG